MNSTYSPEVPQSKRYINQPSTVDPYFILLVVKNVFGRVCASKLNPVKYTKKKKQKKNTKLHSALITKRGGLSGHRFLATSRPTRFVFFAVLWFVLKNLVCEDHVCVSVQEN